MAKTNKQLEAMKLSAYGNTRGADLQNMEFPLQIKRQYAGAIDTTEIWTSLAEAQEYAKTSAVKYDGQMLQVVEDGAVTAYMIKGTELVPVGKATVGDGKSIQLVDGVLSIVGFDDIVEEGFQLVTKLVDGEVKVAWVKPDTSTVEGLSTAVETLQQAMLTTIKVTDIATTSKAGIVKSQEEGVGHVVVGADGTMNVSSVAKAQNADVAEDSKKLGGKEASAYADAATLETVKTSAESSAKDLADIKAGTLPVPNATEADVATKLKTPRSISGAGDVNITKVSFDGTADVTLTTVLKDVITAGTGCKVTVDAKGRVTKLEQLVEADIPNLAHTKITGLGTAATKNVGNAAGNVVVLASDGKIDSALLPSIAITETFVVASEAEMLKLNTQVGDIAIRSDLSKTFICVGDPKTIAGWKELLTPTDAVVSVNGKTGAVVLTTDNINEGANNKYYTATRFNEDFAKSNSTSLADSNTLLRNTDILILDGGTSA